MKRITVADIAPLVESHKGNIAAIGRVLGVSRMTVQRRVDGSPELQKMVEDSRESMKDNAESVLYKKILDGDTACLIFFLKTRCKDRGYVERQEVTGADGGPIKHVNESELDREIASLVEEHERRAQAGDSQPSSGDEVGLETVREAEAATA